MGVIFGFVSFLVFVAMAVLHESWAGPHERGDDLGPLARRGKKRMPLHRT